jgi:signal peptidase I
VVAFAGPTASWNDGWSSARSRGVMVRGLQNIASWLGLAPPDENDLVKRVVATGGQTVKCCDEQGRVVVDGVSLTEPYVDYDFAFTPGQLDCATPQRSQRCFGPVTVPSGALWVMGDNRSDSRDSRYHVTDELSGAVPVSDVRGHAVLVVHARRGAAGIWLPGRIGGV